FRRLSLPGFPPCGGCFVDRSGLLARRDPWPGKQRTGFDPWAGQPAGELPLPSKTSLGLGLDSKQNQTHCGVQAMMPFRLTLKLGSVDSVPILGATEGLVVPGYLDRRRTASAH